MKTQQNTTTLYPISESHDMLLTIMDNIEEIRRILAKSNSMAVVLYEAILSMQDFPARVGDEVLLYASDIICDYTKQTDDAISALYEQLDTLHEQKYQLYLQANN